MPRHRRWYEFSPGGMVEDCELFIHFLVWRSPTDAEPRRFQLSLREAVLIVGLFALSFGMMRHGLLVDSFEGLRWLIAGVNVFTATMGASIERLITPRRRGAVGALVASIPVWLFGGFFYLMALCFEGIEHLP